MRVEGEVYRRGIERRRRGVEGKRNKKRGRGKYEIRKNLPSAPDMIVFSYNNDSLCSEDHRIQGPM
jgi:hypothetical protein